MALRFTAAECSEQFFVLRVLDRVRQILAQKLGRAARDLDRELDVWLRQNVGKIRFGCDQNVRRLRFDRNDAAQPIFQRREFARYVNVKIDRVRVGHRVALENRHVLDEKKLTADRRLQNAQIDRIARAEFFEIEFFQPIVEPLQARKLGVDRQSRVVIDLAVVLMETQSDSLERPRGQVAFDEFLARRC